MFVLRRAGEMFVLLLIHHQSSGGRARRAAAKLSVASKEKHMFYSPRWNPVTQYCWGYTGWQMVFTLMVLIITPFLYRSRVISDLNYPSSIPAETDYTPFTQRSPWYKRGCLTLIRATNGVLVWVATMVASSDVESWCTPSSSPQQTIQTQTWRVIWHPWLRWIE
jgi:hypothetical protein